MCAAYNPDLPPTAATALQLREFYGPLLACVTATKSAYDAMLKQHSANGSRVSFSQSIAANPDGPEARAYRCGGEGGQRYWEDGPEARAYRCWGEGGQRYWEDGSEGLQVLGGGHGSEGLKVQGGGGGGPTGAGGTGQRAAGVGGEGRGWGRREGGRGWEAGGRGQRGQGAGVGRGRWGAEGGGGGVEGLGAGERGQVLPVSPLPNDALLHAPSPP